MAKVKKTELISDAILEYLSKSPNSYREINLFKIPLFSLEDSEKYDEGKQISLASKFQSAFSELIKQDLIEVHAWEDSLGSLTPIQFADLMGNYVVQAKITHLGLSHMDDQSRLHREEKSNTKSRNVAIVSALAAIASAIIAGASMWQQHGLDEIKKNDESQQLQLKEMDSTIRSIDRTIKMVEGRLKSTEIKASDSLKASIQHDISCSDSNTLHSSK